MSRTNVTIYEAQRLNREAAEAELARRTTESQHD
jgi:CIC family chloride channel protein